MTRKRKSPELMSLLAVQASLMTKLAGESKKKTETSGQTGRDLADVSSRISQVRERERKAAVSKAGSGPTHDEYIAAFKALANVISDFVPEERRAACMDAVVALAVGPKGGKDGKQPD
jgi:hypothetical protein